MKTLIIVCDENHKKYGDFLSQLVSLEDDKDGKIIGTQDGTVAAQVWSEEEYKNNSATISSTQYMLFIGNGKLAKEKRTHMVVKYEQFGMKYGWLGKQASLCVESTVDVEDYESFYTYASEQQDNVERLIEQKELPEQKNETDGKGLTDLIKKVPDWGILAFKQIVSNKKIEEQQYSCLTYVFYLNGLSNFLGL